VVERQAIGARTERSETEAWVRTEFVNSAHNEMASASARGAAARRVAPIQQGLASGDERR
jgi:hypothetical protein